MSIFLSILNKVNEFVGKIGTDKYAHFLVSLLLTFMCTKLFVIFGNSVVISMILAFTVSFLVGIPIKEFLVDKYIRKGNADKGDMIADILGTLISILLYFVAII